MIIETKFFGPVEVNENEVITFKQGIPGFENFHRYAILQYKDGSPFHILQSLEKVNLAMVIVELATVLPEYSFDLADEAVAQLNLARPEDATVVVVVVLPEDITKATVNLAAPIVINQATKLAKQIILEHPAFSLRHPLFNEKPVSLERQAAAK